MMKCNFVCILWCVCVCVFVGGIFFFLMIKYLFTNTTKQCNAVKRETYPVSAS